VSRSEEAADDLVNDYQIHGPHSMHTAKLRLRNYLTPFFRHRRLGTITTAGATSGSINRDLTLLKRMFTLALQAGMLMTRPNNVPDLVGEVRVAALAHSSLCQWRTVYSCRTMAR